MPLVKVLRLKQLVSHRGDAIFCVSMVWLSLVRPWIEKENTCQLSLITRVSR